MSASTTSPKLQIRDMIKIIVDADKFNHFLQSNGYDESSNDKIKAANPKEKLAEYIMEILEYGNGSFDDTIKYAETFKRNQKRLVDEIETILTKPELSFEDADKVNKKIDFIMRWYDKLISTGHTAFSSSLFVVRDSRSWCNYNPKERFHFLIELDGLVFANIDYVYSRHIVKMIMDRLDSLAPRQMEGLALLVFENILNGEMRFSEFDLYFIEKYDKVLRLMFDEGDQKLIKRYGGNSYRGI